MSWRRNQLIKFSYEKFPSLIPFQNPVKESWTSSTHNNLKIAIKNHYSIVQNDTCAYCRLPIRFAGYGEPIEHIFPKSLKIKWMFHPFNLCLSCYGCNTKKQDKDTLVDINLHPDDYSSYPTQSEMFKIVHPHFDIFSTHIIEENFIYKPRNNSPKGKNTIEICKLNRFDVLYTKARLKKNSHRDIHSKLMDVILDNSFDLEERSAAQEMVDKIIDRYNYHRNLVVNNP